MTTLPDGPYAYYTAAKLPPIICEIFHGYVLEAGEEGQRPLSSYGGRFVPLVEVKEQEPVKQYIDSNANIV